MNDSIQKHGILVELSERAARLPNWKFCAGMAILKMPGEDFSQLEPVRVIEWSGDWLTVLDPATGIQRVQGLFEPAVDLSDPMTFGYLIGMCSRVEDYEADRIYELFDCGDLASSANVILDVLEDALPF